jgi:hypothetical protein
MNPRLACALAAISLLVTPLVSVAEEMTVDGTIAGYNCVVRGIACPIDAEDPVIAAENVFVLSVKDGYYLLPNLDRAVLARHINEKARVKGDWDKKYNSIDVDTFEVKKGEKWTMAWSKRMQAEWNRRFERD